MRCDCCNTRLNDFEATNKDLGGRYLNTCRKCLSGLGIAQLGRPDLNPNEEEEDEDFEEYIDDPEDADDEWQSS
jgi:hypothetical protein